MGKHQSLDKLEKAREKTRRRVAKHREKQKQKLLTGCNVTVTESNADRIEEEKEEEKEREKEAEAVKGAGAPNYDDGDNKLNYFNRNLLLTENQIADLLERMGLEIFNEYIDRLSCYIEENGATNIKSHYATLLKWYNEDCAVVS